MNHDKQMLNTMISNFVSQFTLTFSEASREPQQVKFDRYVYWLERKLMATSAVEISDLDDTIDQLAEKILFLKSIAVQCRATMIVYNAGQVNRIQKLYDLVDSLTEPYLPGRLFVSSGKSAITSLLPDSDVLRDLVVQNRIKLKAVDEIASSKKTEVVKFKGSKLTTSNRSESKKAVEISLIRTEVKNILALLDTLAVELGKKMPVLSYYGQMKQLVHFPLQTLSTNLHNLPSLSEAASHRDHEVEQVRKAELQYNNLRKTEILAVAAKSSQEAAYIENTVHETMEFLRALGKEEVVTVVNEAFANEQYVTSVGDNGVVNVKRYTACNTIELLKLCANENRSAAFVDFIERLQRLWPSIEKAVGCSVSKESVDALLAFDADLFVAYAVDWQERIAAYDSAVKKADFMRAYEQLCQGRAAYDKARHRLDLAIQRHSEALSLHREANAQVNQLKDRFIEIALSELSEDIEFIA